MAKASARPLYADRVDNDPTYRHSAFSDWLTENTGYEVDVKSVQLALSLVNEFRVSPAAEAAEKAQVARREAAVAAKRTERADKVRAKAEKLKAQIAELEAKADEIAPATSAPKKAAAKKAAPAAAPAKAPAKAAGRKPLAVVPDDDPVEDDDEF